MLESVVLGKALQTACIDNENQGVLTVKLWVFTIGSLDSKYVGWQVYEAERVAESEQRQRVHAQVHPTPYTLHPTPYTLLSAPYTLHPTPHTRHSTP